MTFVPDIQPDQQGRNVFENARCFKLSAIQGSNAGNLCSELANHSIRFWNVPTNDHVAFDSGVTVQHFGGSIVKRGDHRGAFRNEFSGGLSG